MSEYVVRSIEFDQEGITLQYMVVPDDVRDDGRLVAHHMLSVSYHQDEVGDVATRVREQVEQLCRDAVVEFTDAEIVAPPADTEDEDDDDRGMGE